MASAKRAAVVCVVSFVFNILAVNVDETTDLQV